MKYNETIEKIISLTKQNISQSELAKILGVRRQLINNRAKRNSTFSNDEIKKIEDCYNIKLDSRTNTLTDAFSILYRPNVSLSAGFGLEVFDEDSKYIILDASLFITERGLRINPKHCEIITVSGNSMANEYKDGDRVIINKNDVILVDGHTYAIRYDGKCFIKEINLLNNKIKCISINKEYDSFYIQENEDYTVLGRILPRIRL